MILRIFSILFLWILSFSIHAQKWEGRTYVLKSNRGKNIDSVKLLEWPKTPPSYLELDKQDFIEFGLTKLHNDRLDFEYTGTGIYHTEMTDKERSFWKGNYAVYYDVSGNLENAQLYGHGVCIGQVTYPVTKDGHYLTLIAWGSEKDLANKNGEGRMIYCIVKNGIVTLHDSINCD